MELRDRVLNDDKGENFAITYSLNSGIKKFGDKAYNAAYKEVGQLHHRDCFNPIDVTTLSPEEKRKALESLIFIAEKDDGDIKARQCANGSKQRQWINKEDSASPTAALESIMLTGVIEA